MQEELNGMRARPARNHRQVGRLLLGVCCSAAEGSVCCCSSCCCEAVCVPCL
jgi:hypothetical protein